MLVTRRSSGLHDLITCLTHDRLHIHSRNLDSSQCQVDENLFAFQGQSLCFLATFIHCFNSTREN